MVYLPTFTIKINHSIGTYTVRPMDGSWDLYTIPETNSSHLKMDGWKTIVSFGKAYFQG